MSSIVIVSATQTLSARLPEVMADRDLDLEIIGSTSGHLLGSPFIDSYDVVAPTPGDFGSTLNAHPELLDRGADWVLYDQDDLIRALTRGPWPDNVKRQVLPAATDLGLHALGSKIGQQALAEHAGVPTPAARVVDRPEDVRDAMAEMGGSLVLKSDVGGGGAQVWPLRDARDLARVPRLEDQLPALVQEWIDGELISVEPLYRRGRLLGLQYSRVERALGGGRGPSTRRRFLDPPADVVDALVALGETGGLHGFGNLTFIRHPERGHVLVECDMRINTCVQYGPQLGVDWGSLLAGDHGSEVATTSLGPEGRVIHVYPRAFSAGLSEMSWVHLGPWLRREAGTWDARNHRDPAVNAAERRDLVGGRALARHFLHDPMRATWLRLPPQARESLERRGWKRRALDSMGIRV